MNDQPQETHHLRHEPCGGSTRMLRRLETTGPRGFVNVQRNRIGDEYYQVMEDLVLKFFFQSKTTKLLSIMVLFHLFLMQHCETRGGTLLCTDGIVTR